MNAGSLKVDALRIIFEVRITGRSCEVCNCKESLFLSDSNKKLLNSKRFMDVDELNFICICLFHKILPEPKQ